LTSLEVIERETLEQNQTKVITRIITVLQDGRLLGSRAAWALCPERRPARLDYLLTATNATSRRLISLSLDSIRSSWLSKNACLQWNKNLAAENVFSGLKKFNSSVTPLYYAKDVLTARFLQKAIMKHTRHLTQMQITAAKVNHADLRDTGHGPHHNVEDLRLHIDHLWSMPPQKYPIRSLKLKGVSASSRQVHNMLQALASTLEDLTLKDVRLSSGSWVLMWRSMAETLQLQKIKLSSSFKAAAESWIPSRYKKYTYQPCSPSSMDPPTTPWSQMMFDLGCFFWETMPTSNTLQKLEQWILSNGQGEFPLVPFYTPRCRDHHYPSMGVYNAYCRESAVRELLADDSFDFVRDNLLHTRDEQEISCPKTCRNYADEGDCIATSLLRESYIKQLLTCLMVLQRAKLAAKSFYPPWRLLHGRGNLAPTLQKAEVRRRARL
jgi:hypothetical protein